MPDPHYCRRMVSCSPASGFDPDGLFAGHKQTPAAVNNRAGVYVAQTFPQTWSLLSSSKIKPQGRVRQVRVIILRSRSHQHVLAVVVVSITEIPGQVPVELHRDPSFRRLEVHRIRVNQRAWRSGGIRETAPLSTVLIDAIGRVERHSWD